MTPATKITLWPQWFTGLTVCLAVLTAGLSNGWTSPYLAQLTSPHADTPMKLTDNEASWVASLLPLGRFAGAITGAITQGVIGRRKTLILAMLPLVFGWISNITSKTITWLYIARFFCGVGSAMVWTTLSLFLGEIADPSIRGFLIFLNTNAASVGAFIGTAIGPYLPMDQFGYVSLTIIILFIVLIYFIPESPYHHVLNGNMERAELSLKWFKREADASKEIQELKEFIGSTNIPSTFEWSGEFMFLIWFMLRVLFGGRWMSAAENVSPQELERVINFYRAFHVFVMQLIMRQRTIPEVRFVYEGHFSIHSRDEKRLLRKQHRDHLQAFDKKVDSTLGEIEDFDFFGIRWMHAGLWGCDHPVRDWAHPLWGAPNQCAHTYECLDAIALIDFSVVDRMII